MKIIIEGLDNSGKDTQINAIIKHFKKTFLHLHYYGCPIKENAEKSIKWTTDLYTEMFNVLKCHDNVICNRSHLGEIVYAPIYRGYSGDFVIDIERTYPHDDLSLITFIDKAENVIARDDGLSFSTNLEDKQNEISAFSRAHKMSTIKHKILINIHGLSVQSVTDKIIEFLEMKKGNK